MHFLIAGGVGFLGSHFSEYLLAKGHTVLCIDSLITARHRNLELLNTHAGFSFINHDLSEPLGAIGPLDAIVNFASPASPQDYQRYSVETLKAGALATFNLLDLAHANKARFLLASTSEVYGDPEVHPQNEDYRGHVDPTGPRSMYDEAKRFAEAATIAFHRSYQLDVKIARIFNTYGPRMRSDDGRVIPSFVSQALDRKPLTVFGNGEQTRSFCYVSDLIEGLWSLLQSKEHGPINLGNPEELSIRKLAELVILVSGNSSSLTFSPRPPDDPARRQPDITKARTLLGWEPRVSLREGLEETIRWFYSNR